VEAIEDGLAEKCNGEFHSIRFRGLSLIKTGKGPELPPHTRESKESPRKPKVLGSGGAGPKSQRVFYRRFRIPESRTDKYGCS